jgi:hypothetical protein
MNRSIIIILFSVWDCFFQPATGAQARQDPKIPTYVLNGAGALNASNRSITQHSLRIDNKKIKHTAIAASITIRGEQSEPKRLAWWTYALPASQGLLMPCSKIQSGGFTRR